jgi:GTP-binding protein YchF
VTHVEGSINPVRDAEIIMTELMLADLQALEKRAAGLEKKAKTGDKEAKEMMAVINPVLGALQDGRVAATARPAAEGMKIYKELNLLTAKPVLYVANVAEEDAPGGNAYGAALAQLAEDQGSRAVVIAAAVEAEAAGLGEDRDEYLRALGLAEPGLNKVIRAAFELLSLQTFFTVGPKEIRAWTVRKGATAPQAAGEIHTDFAKGFIRAEVIAYDDFIACQGETGAKAAGKMRTEGKGYAVADGDIMHFLWAR